jgi:hypothetical protein
MLAVLEELAQSGFSDLTDSVEFLQIALGGTQQDLITARSGIIQYGEAWGYTKEQIAAIRGALEEHIGIAEPAILATRRHADALAAAAGGARDFKGALQALADQQKEATDPIFAAERAQDRLNEAHEKYVRASIEHGEASGEANDALGDLLQAQRDVESANRGLRDSFSGESLAALKAWSDQLGIARDNLQGYVNAVREAAGLPSISIGNPEFAPPPTTGRRANTPEGRRLSQINHIHQNFVVNDTADAQRRTLAQNQRALERLNRETVR